MTGFEYASGLISIVVGLGIARVLGGVGAFLRLHNRTPHDWIVGTWCLVLFLTLVVWWMLGWQLLRLQAQIASPYQLDDIAPEVRQDLRESAERTIQTRDAEIDRVCKQLT